MINVPVTETLEVGGTIVSAGQTFGDEASSYPGGMTLLLIALTALLGLHAHRPLRVRPANSSL